MFQLVLVNIADIEQPRLGQVGRIFLIQAVNGHYPYALQYAPVIPLQQETLDEGLVDMLSHYCRPEQLSAGEVVRPDPMDGEDGGSGDRPDAVPGFIVDERHQLLLGSVFG